MTTTPRTMRVARLAAAPPWDMPYRVWWIPQIPMDDPFYVLTPNLDEAVALMDVLASYDLYQFDNNVKPDYCNVGGVERWDGSAWEDVDEDELAERQDALADA